MSPHFTDSRAVSRRELLRKAGMGIGSLALLDLMSREATAATNPLAPHALHHAPRARAVISLFMHGGPSQVDTFDPKPLLAKYAGQTLPESFGNLNLEFTKTSTAKVLASQRTFRKCGQSGVEISDIFEHLPKVADELAIVRSCYHTEFNHAPALYMAHSGTRLMGRPSLGAWAMYGLGSDSENLPGYVVMRDGPLKGGPMTYGNGFLPAVYSATELRTSGAPILYLDRPDAMSAGDQRRILDFSQQLNRRYLASQDEDSNLSARIAAYELAYRMQAAAPDAVDLSKEPESVKSLYGLDNDITRPFGTQCLNARRLVERGVRFVQLYHGGGGDGWDTHGGNDAKHLRNGRQIDKPIAGLIMDLKARGLLDSTLIIWGGEFGRTPTSEGSDGRDHSPYGYSVWMAGGGVKGGTVFGATDDFGFKAIENPVQVRDLHATILHLLGLKHDKLSYYFQGIQQRLTQIDGESRVIKEILA
ncbi:MAG: Uncharacterized conserved protein, DUF1501 family [Verrucomicrobia bacterium]|nr:MAG: Uncharacterized conserved protein, DUF1501 family [Verrucomicrobiota bacterium]